MPQGGRKATGGRRTKKATDGDRYGGKCAGGVYRGQNHAAEASPFRPTAEILARYGASMANLQRARSVLAAQMAALG